MIMGTKEAGAHRLQVEKPSGSEMGVDIPNGALIAHKLEVELADMVLETADPVNLLCMVVMSFLLTLADELRKVLNEVSNLCHAKSGDCGVDDADDSGGKGPRVVVGPGWPVQ